MTALSVVPSVAGGDGGQVLHANGLGIDGEAHSQLAETLVPEGAIFGRERREGITGRAQDLVPDVLRLPEVQFKG